MKIFISAGETSGDVHGAHLVSELSKIDPEIKFIGIGSERLKAARVEIFFDISPQGTIGLTEVLPNLISIYSIFLKAKKLLLDEKPDLLILVDSQGFNVPLAEYAKSIGIKTVYYIAPQEWLWGTMKATKKISELVDLIIAIFPKEFEIYKSCGANVKYFGHPLLDIAKPVLPSEEIIEKYKPYGHPLVCLCPGSRKQEITNVYPKIIEASIQIKKNAPNTTFAVLVASDWIEDKINKIHEKYNFEAQMVKEKRYDLLGIADLAIATSGTINLEASILGTPNIMVYRLSPLTYWIGKNILKIDKKLKYFSMPNILLSEAFIPEFIQDNATASKISEESLKILKMSKRLDNKKLLNVLGASPVISKIAEAILSFTR